MCFKYLILKYYDGSDKIYIIRRAPSGKLSCIELSLWSNSLGYEPEKTYRYTEIDIDIEEWSRKLYKFVNNRHNDLCSMCDGAFFSLECVYDERTIALEYLENHTLDQMRPLLEPFLICEKYGVAYARYSNK